jgi:2-polyprenyl-3-methyl-5-hydroxy-6-metoxy-1,4-benzoquinol methylase
MNESGQRADQRVDRSDDSAPNADPRFVAYYKRESSSDQTRHRAQRIKVRVEALLRGSGRWPRRLTVADIGCGAGAHSQLWSEAGHEVFGLDVSQPLIEIAKQRTQELGLEVKFEVGSATALPYADQSVDVCILPELLEHIADWECCLREAARVVRVGGVLYLSTTNVFCPVQEEFTLPCYSWYPSVLKRRYEQLAVTTRPELVHFASFPAVNWFSYYGLRDFLKTMGLASFDRFDLIGILSQGTWKGRLATAVARQPSLKFLAQFVVPSCLIFAVRER